MSIQVINGPTYVLPAGQVALSVEADKVRMYPPVHLGPPSADPPATPPTGLADGVQLWAADTGGRVRASSSTGPGVGLVPFGPDATTGYVGNVRLATAGEVAAGTGGGVLTSSYVGAPDGVAPLGVDGKLPLANLPSGIEDVVATVWSTTPLALDGAGRADLVAGLTLGDGSRPAGEWRLRLRVMARSAEGDDFRVEVRCWLKRAAAAGAVTVELDETSGHGRRLLQLAVSAGVSDDSLLVSWSHVAGHTVTDWALGWNATASTAAGFPFLPAPP